MKNKPELIDLLKKHILPEYQLPIINAIESSIRIETIPNKAPSLGASKMGGVPHLPKGMKWPIDSAYDNKPFTFIGQVNLEEICELDESKLLPPKGILYFFLAYNSFDHGLVLFEPNPKALEPSTVPSFFQEEEKNWFQKLFRLKGSSRVLKECAVQFHVQYDTPSWDSLILFLIQLNVKNKIDNTFAYNENILDQTSREFESDHHLLGYYFPIQGGYLELDFIKSTTKIEHLTKVEIEKALEWKLLFQADSDKNLNISWGHWGKIYFFIHKEDLAKADFTKVRITGECY